MQYLNQDINIGQRLRALRLARKLTQPRLVEKMQICGSTISRSTYSNIESGRRNIKVSDLIILKHVLSVEYSELFCGLMPNLDEQ